MTNSAQLRRQARQALKGNWQTALLVRFCAGIIGIITIIVQLYVQYHLPRETVLLNASVPSVSDVLNTYVDRQRQLRNDLIFNGLLLSLEFILSYVLVIGLNNYFLQLLRGQKAGFTLLLFSRLYIFSKCLGQSVMVFLYLAGWLLIVFAPLALAISFTQGLPGIMETILLLGLACIYLAVVLRYAMAPYILADHPDMGVMESIRESKRMMGGQAGRLFKLGVSFVGYFALGVAVEMGLRVISPVVGTVAGLCCGLVLSVYFDAACAAFYLDLSSAKEMAKSNVQGSVE